MLTKDDIPDYTPATISNTCAACGRPVRRGQAKWDQERKRYRFASEPATESSDLPPVDTASAEEAFEGKGR